MNRYQNEGQLIDRYLNNIERQHNILNNLLETINRQNLASRNLINSYLNPFAPRSRESNFNRNWNRSITPFYTALNSLEQQNQSQRQSQSQGQSQSQLQTGIILPEVSGYII